MLYEISKMKSILLPGLCCAVLPTVETLAQKNKSDKPNIIYILADDMGYGDIGILGQRLIKTPNIDRLARDGMIFTRHYAGAPVSSPSRCSLMTGVHTGHTLIRGNKKVPGVGALPIDHSVMTTPEAIKVNTDYVTGMSGRWHLGEEKSPDQTPYRRGFDYHFGKLSSDYANKDFGVMYDTLWHKDGRHVPYDDYSKIGIEPVYENGKLYNLNKQELAQRPINLDKLVTQKAVSFIENNKNRNFFLYVAYCLPHAPMQFHENTPPTAYLNEIWNPLERAFASMVQALDSYVGMIVEQVDKLGLSDKTLIIFASDNGAHYEGGHDYRFFKSNGPFNGIKRDLIEGGIHVPMIVRWTNTIKAGTQTNHLSAFWDIMPTVCELAGAPIPAQTDGISFAPTLTGKGKQRQHEYLYWEFSEHPTVAWGHKAPKPNWPRQTVIFDDHWKVIHYVDEEKTEVYDLSKDITEGYDLSLQRPDIMQRGLSIMKKAHTPNDNYPLLKSERKK